MDALWYLEHDLEEVQRRAAGAKAALKEMPYDRHYKEVVSDFTNIAQELQRQIKALKLRQTEQ